MMASVSGKTVAQSVTEMTELVLPNDSNMLGNILGGRVMHFIDLAAAITCARHAGHVAVTASMDRVDFRHPIRVGQVIELQARLNWAGSTSMEVEVQVFCQDLRAGTRVLTSTAFLTFVALDDEGHPVRVPPLVLTTPEEERRFREAEERRAERLRRRS
ncbi:MAG: acyl-CoA thioesterase [Thermaerobacter sp.]|nr:acyl-CoA thioesterase [Thermaerobacter sp.]